MIFCLPTASTSQITAWLYLCDWGQYGWPPLVFSWASCYHYCTQMQHMVWVMAWCPLHLCDHASIVLLHQNSRNSCCLRRPLEFCFTKPRQVPSTGGQTHMRRENLWFLTIFSILEKIWNKNVSKMECDRKLYVICQMVILTVTSVNPNLPYF